MPGGGVGGERGASACCNLSVRIDREISHHVGDEVKLSYEQEIQTIAVSVARCKKCATRLGMLVETTKHAEHLCHTPGLRSG